MASAGSEHPLDRRIDDVEPLRSPVSRASRNSIVINKKRLEKIRRRLSDPDADVPVKTMFEVDDGDSIYNADAIAAARTRAARRTKGLDSQDLAHGDSFSDIAAAAGRTHRTSGARDSIVLAHDRLAAPSETLLPKLAPIPDTEDDMASEMQRLDIIEAARKRALMHKNHKDSMGAGVFDEPAPTGRSKIRSRDSMVLNRVRLTEPATGDKNTAKIRSRDSVVLHKVRMQPPTGIAASADSGKPLHKGWLLKNPIAERASMKAKWKVPSGRAKRRWFVLYSTSDRNTPALSYYTDAKQSTLKGTLYLDTTWSVQRAKTSSSAKKKLTFELFSERQGLLVQADSVEESNTWLHYLETLLRRLKRIMK